MGHAGEASFAICVVKRMLFDIVMMTPAVDPQGRCSPQAHAAIMTRVADFGAVFPAYREDARSAPKVHRPVWITRRRALVAPAPHGSWPPERFGCGLTRLASLYSRPGASIVARARGIAQIHVVQPLVLEVYLTAMLLLSCVACWWVELIMLAVDVRTTLSRRSQAPA